MNTAAQDIFLFSVVCMLLLLLVFKLNTALRNVFLRHPRGGALFIVQVANYEAHDNEHDGHCGDGYVALEVSWSIDLLPD